MVEATLPRPGNLVGWRDTQHAQAHGWVDAYGPGPFEVVGVVDHGEQGLPAGLVLKTRLGEQEVNAVWLVPADQSEKETDVL
jgi:hypothetical protein